jgi:UDP-apiose/xylose synthase
VQILILGAGGFIGSNLTEHLLKETDHVVIGLDEDDEKTADIVAPAERFVFHKIDITRNQPAVDRLIQQSDLVIDLIAYANPSVYVSQPLDVVDLNLFQNLRAVDACVRYGKRLIQFSTCEVYGLSSGSREPFQEDTTNLIMGPIKNQRWIYACAKQLLERMVFAYGQTAGLEFTIVRPFNFVGPKIDYLVEAGSVGGPRVFSHFMSALIGGGPLQLVDGGTAHRSYTHIYDACTAIRLLIDKPDACRNEIVNIGNPHNGTTIRELAHLMVELYEELTGEKSRSSIVDISSERFYGAGYEDCDWRVPDVSKMLSLGWDPKLDLRETFKQTMQWYLDRLATDAPLPSFLRANPVESVR